MASKEAIQKKLRSAQLNREGLADTFQQLEEYNPFTDEMLANYLGETQWLEQNAQKVLESSDPSMKTVAIEIKNEIVYSKKLDELYTKNLVKKKMTYDAFLTEVRMANAALRDGTIEAAGIGGMGGGQTPGGRTP